MSFHVDDLENAIKAFINNTKPFGVDTIEHKAEMTSEYKKLVMKYQIESYQKCVDKMDRDYWSKSLA